MDNNKLEVLQKLLSEIHALKEGIETAGNLGRAKLQDIKVDDVIKSVSPKLDGKVDETEWNKLTDGEKEKLRERIVLIRDSLKAVRGLDGPNDPGHIMYSAYASNTCIITWSLIGFFLMAVLLFEISSHWSQATGTDFAITVGKAKKAVKELDQSKQKAKELDAAMMEIQRTVANAVGKEKEDAEKILDENTKKVEAKHKEVNKAEEKAQEKC